MSREAISLIAVTRRGTEQARLLRQRLRAGQVYRPARYGPPEHGWESVFAGPLSERVPELFAQSRHLVFFLAAGAVTRLIAPCLASKLTDPGVLAVDEAAHFVIPLLSGHKGGANAFARTVAGCLGAVPVITTASDVIGGLSLDMLEDAFGWIAEPRQRLKPVARAIVDGEPIGIVQEIGTPGGWLDEIELPANATCVRDAGNLNQRSFGYVLWITDRVVDDLRGIDEASILWYRPRSLALGVGCERGISEAALDDGLSQFLRDQRYCRTSIEILASVELKMDEDGLTQFAVGNGWQRRFFPTEQLAQAAGIANPSEVVARCVGTPGVAEPAALLAAGCERLLAEKKVIASGLAPQRMTFALARLAAYSRQPPLTPNPSPPSTGERGAVTGRVIFVGAGPGDPDLLTLKAQRALAQADLVVYAGSLVPEEILRHASRTAGLQNSAPLTLEQVVDCITTAVRAGHRVVRLHSGDTSIYSAMQEQMTLLDAAGIEYEVIPGVSSFQAAAAALGLELTLPEVVQTIILTRAEGQTRMPDGEALADLARHRATMCVFLSARLVDQVQARLLTAYPPETPVAIAYRVSWPDEKFVLTQLDRLADEVRRNQLTRTTLILIGEAIGGRRNRSQLYNRKHGHLFRAADRDTTHPSA